MFIRLIIAALMVALSACISTGHNLPPLETVDAVDLERYMGEWFIIANIPYFAERGNVASRALYTRREGSDKMDDIYYFREEFDEPVEEMRGSAWVVNDTTNAVWKTRFFWPFTFDYYILALTEDYRAVAVGHPSRDYAWIMAREPRLDDTTYDAMIAVFGRQGWDTSRIMKVPQFPEQRGKEGFQTDES